MATQTQAAASRTPARKVPGRNGYRYKPQWAVVVVCRDEAHQAAVYTRMQRQGYKLRVVSV